MSALLVYAEDQPEQTEQALHDGDAIADLLARVGVQFERWTADRALRDGASQAEILAAYATEIARLNAEGGYQTADVVRLAAGTEGTANIGAMRQKFLSEHRHAEDEVRYFVEGSGTFYLHIEGKVYVLLCERNDLIRVPANTRHWFDMGENPSFCAIRLFINPEGWVGHFTGDRIATKFLTHDEAVAWLAKA